MGNVDPNSDQPVGRLVQVGSDLWFMADAISGVTTQAMNHDRVYIHIRGLDDPYRTDWPLESVLEALARAEGDQRVRRELGVTVADAAE